MDVNHHIHRGGGGGCGGGGGGGGGGPSTTIFIEVQHSTETYDKTKYKET